MEIALAGDTTGDTIWFGRPGQPRVEIRRGAGGRRWRVELVVGGIGGDRIGERASLVTLTYF